MQCSGISETTFILKHRNYGFGFSGTLALCFLRATIPRKWEEMCAGTMVGNFNQFASLCALAFSFLCFISWKHSIIGRYFYWHDITLHVLENPSPFIWFCYMTAQHTYLEDSCYSDHNDRSQVWEMPSFWQGELFYCCVRSPLPRTCTRAWKPSFSHHHFKRNLKVRKGLFLFLACGSCTKSCAWCCPV